MKDKVFSIFVLLLAVAVLCGGAPAQKISSVRSPIKTGPIKTEPVSRSIKAEPVSRPSTVMGDIQVYVDGLNGAVINWQTTSELGNAGFNVYRMDSDGTQRIVNDSLIAGSLIRAGEKTETNGQTYSAYDPQGRADAVYYIETLDKYGRKSLYGPIAPQYTPSIKNEKGYNERLQPGYVGPDPSLVLQNFPAPLKASKGGTRSAESILPDPVNQKWVASQPGVKIKVNKAGIYHIAKADLQAAGFNVASPPANWQLYLNGVEQKIIVDPAGDFIEFYGTGIDIESADFQMYYLIAGATPGARMPEVVRIPVGPFFMGQNFRDTINYEPRINYVGAQIVNGDLDNWFGPVMSSASTMSRSVSVKDIDHESADVTVTVAVHGLTATSHSVQVKLNGSFLALLQFDGIVPFSKSVSIKANSLLEGTNNFEFIALAGGGDIDLLDHITLEYWRLYKADQNALAFTTQNLTATRVTGFNSSNIRVFDFNLDGEAQLLTNAQILPGSGGTFDVQIPQGRPGTMLAVNENSLLSPVSITLNTPSTLSSTPSAADMLIVSNGNFMTEANNWANYRRGQGLVVDVVNVEDAFDEFDYGHPSWQAMKSYLLFAKAANNNLKYVMLVGDATYDPRNYLGLGYNTLIPTRFIDTSEGESPSDETLADANDDGVGELAIGRIPVRDSASITQILGKITSYEAALTPTSLMTRGVLFVSDDPIGWDFVAMSHRLRDELPAAMPATFVNAPDQSDPAVIRQQIVSGVNAGPLFANYAGHGSTRVWSTRQILRFTPSAPATNDLIGLNNSAGDKLSVFLMLTCLNGYFVDPTEDSIAEGMIKLNNGGSPTTWASTGSTTPNIQEEMAVVFFHLLGQGTYTRLGDATHAAKLNATSPEVPLTWAIIGDPALKIK